MSAAKTEHKKTKGEMKAGIKAIWRHMQQFRPTVNWLIILGIISALANGAVPYVTGRFYDALIKLSQHQASSGLWGWPVWALFLGVWAMIQLVANNVDWIKDRMRRRVENSLNFKIETDGFTHMFRLPLSYHKNAHTNGELQKISQASWRISAIVSTVANMAPQFLSVLIGIILAASINPMLAGILALGVGIYLVILIRMLLPIADISTAAHKVWNEGWDDAAAAVQQVESVKQATGEAYEIEKVRSNLLVSAYNLWMRLERHWSNVNFYQQVIVFLTQLTVFLLSVRLVANGSITVGDLVALNGYALMFFGPFASLGGNWQIIQNGITSAGRVEEIFKEKEEVYQPVDAVKLEHLTGHVRFRDVSFSYGHKQPTVLDGIDLEVLPGQVVAMVGESGVGKSTSISLISGYHFPTKGAVEIDGVDTRKLDLTALRSQIAVVPQEVALFNETVKANIRYGSFQASDEDVLRVAREAHMDEFIQALPEKYDTLVGERGIKLSVGQKQRVAIARAMLRSPAILILDEPTSALDAGTEKIVTESLEKLMRGRTTFIIAHRLSTVRKADKILVFEKGRIVETGSHFELIERPGGVYRKLYEYQIGLH